MEIFKNIQNIDELVKKADAEKRFDATVIVKVFVDDTGNEEFDKEAAYDLLKEYLENVPNAEILSIERNFGRI
jgi:hypothetical protein